MLDALNILCIIEKKNHIIYLYGLNVSVYFFHILKTLFPIQRKDISSKSRHWGNVNFLKCVHCHWLSFDIYQGELNVHVPLPGMSSWIEKVHFRKGRVTLWQGSRNPGSILEKEGGVHNSLSWNIPRRLRVTPFFC